ncbi:MAG: hypothetical protein JO081_18095 [Alphaproteobacteria bacterium]|nr:hypothetical protein [Alphaproteobacteria bacterium]
MTNLKPRSCLAAVFAAMCGEEPMHVANSTEEGWIGWRVIEPTLLAVRSAIRTACTGF